MSDAPAEAPHGLMLCDDLIFYSRVSGAARAAGLTVRMVRTADALVAAARLASPLVSQRLTSFTVRPSTEDLRLLRQLIEAGDLTPVIGGTHSLDEVPEAIGHLEEGHARGKSVIVVET